MDGIIRTREEAEKYNESPMYKEEIAYGMLPFVIGDPAPKYDNAKIPFTREWLIKQNVSTNTTKKYYN